MTQYSEPLQRKLLPSHRHGPRPLPLNLITAANLYLSSNAALPLLRSGLLSWSPSLEKRGKSLLGALENENSDAFAAQVEMLSRARAAEFIEGLELYRNHPYQRDLSEPKILWAQGSTQLLDYNPRSKGQPLLIVPSLVNRHYILDLTAESSFMRWLVGQGFRPFLVDWGAPGSVERNFTITDYITQRLESALDCVMDVCTRSISVIGYCMGGLLATSLALRNQDAINGLVLLATPWDFHSGNAAQAQLMANVGAALEPLLQTTGEVPVDVIQMLFSSLDPLLVERKFVGFAGWNMQSKAAVSFVALEDWVNDGVPLAAPVARECFAGWYGANSPASGTWCVAGEIVDPTTFEKPSLVVIPANDRIVPPQSAASLCTALPFVEIKSPSAGHIGMMIGGKAETKVWKPVAQWLQELH